MQCQRNLKSRGSILKTLWAVEPFHQDKKNTKAMYNLIEQLGCKASDIEAGFIVTRMENELNLAFDIPFEDRFSAYPMKILQDAFAKAKVSIDKKNIHIVDFESFSITRAVDRMLLLAQSRSADLIALHTQSRHGFKRIMLGSFAETIIHRSTVDLLLVNPETQFPTKIKNIFYASDFSPAAKLQLTKVLDLCKKLKANLTVFHAAEIIYRWSLDELNPDVLAYRQKVQKTKKLIEQEAKAAKVPCEVNLSAEYNSIKDLTLQKAKKANADLIVVSAKAGPLAALMGGSIARKIVRSSKKPVLILKHK